MEMIVMKEEVYMYGSLEPGHAPNHTGSLGETPGSEDR